MATKSPPLSQCGFCKYRLPTGIACSQILFACWCKKLNCHKIYKVTLYIKTTWFAFNLVCNYLKNIFILKKCCCFVLYFIVLYSFLYLSDNCFRFFVCLGIFLYFFRSNRKSRKMDKNQVKHVLQIPRNAMWI